MARATSSLPVPFSPVMRTRPLVGAVFDSLSKTGCIALELPSIAKPARPVPTLACSSAFSRRSWAMLRAFLIVRSSFSVLSGFSMKSCAPSLVAVTAVSMLALPLIMSTTTCGWVLRTSARTCKPSISGIMTSSSTRSTSLSASLASPMGPEPATSTR